MNTIEKEVEFVDLLKKIFDKSPKEKKYYNINFNVNDVKNLFFKLLEIFIYGLKKIKSINDEKINIDDLKIEDFNLINKYFNSFGIKIELFINDKLKNANNQNNNKQNLSDYYFEIKNEEINYRIIFKII